MSAAETTLIQTVTPHLRRYRSLALALNQAEDDEKSGIIIQALAALSAALSYVMDYCLEVETVADVEARARWYGTWAHLSGGVAELIRDLDELHRSARRVWQRRITAADHPLRAAMIRVAGQNM